MKRLGVWLIASMLTLGPVAGVSAKEAGVNNVSVAVEKKSAAQYMNRLNEIKQIAVKGNLSTQEKKDLRKEVLDIRKQMQQDPTIVISLSAALLIILLLVLLVD